MANIFNAAEIIDMGIEKEKKRRDFYGLVASKFKEKDMKELFTSLKKWEEEHIKKFTDIRNSVEESEVTESYQGEFAAYMRSLVDEAFYKQVSAKLFAKNVKNPLSAIRYGMGFEKDAIIFFGELLKYIPQHNKEKIELLIEEERKHLIYLANLRKRYE